ncbi:ammonia-forming cytochrome c nitrite reductase [Riemerella anatipestifer]|uniref:nitrite reductase (cytochrome; ammonia-forming) n=1 Tax=Riemerella anatipestifer TaxID=34085 RepID=A0AAP6HGV0_RIEAN|nr:ammonia-forming cytochrome c nitrite reductase [Riemerella anatipestifer]MBT0549310.1 ammonia-forming cytochrome c nitrite reductase [Riemerella anatipestifer]MBT0555871.1 ammonia-forming cytochrome c nitrite reductase [Riemerella anatipestifer]MBT0560073.1 ammonia-forming cytochrome c nitrite reductase [Riemerella anatipestifer]MCD5967759.1 ammonia-forming cytochrome c nitrite reductase [Riemerella anatipestifer]MCO7355030.1 ammonia-forming cytochrome c nitrite reductase [Riemerella anatip
MKRKSWLIVGILGVVIFGLGMLANSIMQRKAESMHLSKANNNIKDFESRNEIWGDSYPREYESWAKTADTTFRSKHMSSNADDLLEERPEMVILWAGYAFAKDYKAPRGHFYSVKDVVGTLRTGAPDANHPDVQPGTCWTCKSPDVPRMMNQMGVENFYKAKWSQLGSDVVNPIGCADCHDPKTMNLTITRPALVEAYQRMGKDIKKATHQEMRSLVCAQCHVEYYFKGDNKYLTFPWDKGMSLENMEEYYDNAKHVDFVHKLSKAPILKAQHPDFEVYNLGIHAQRGVSCADCHMPYKSEGGVKYTDHHISSPLANINNTCQVCHRESETTLAQNVYERQDMVFQLRNRLEKQLAKVHLMAKFLWDNNATEQEMKPVLDLIRKSQWRWDFITASHGAAFHAPLESQRIMGDGLYLAVQAEAKMNDISNKKNISGKFVMPDVSTKAKAQKFIGLDIPKESAAKAQFMKTVVPEWLKKAKAKGVLVKDK